MSNALETCLERSEADYAEIRIIEVSSERRTTPIGICSPTITLKNIKIASN